MDETEKPASKKSDRHLIKIVLIVSALLVCAGLVLFLLADRNQPPLPRKVIKSANFAVYYPSQLPVGYKYDKNSASYQNNILFFTISNGTRKISISEQKAPNNPPDFRVIEKFNSSFKKIDSPVGGAIGGIDTQTRSPVVIILTNTTLININASNDTPNDITTQIAHDLKLMQ